MSTSMNEIEQINGQLHQIIMDEILIRLPVKILCRFKAVSKLWNAVISSHQFAKARLNYNKQLNSKSNWVFLQVEQNSWLLNCEPSDRHDKDPLALSYEEDDKGVQSVSLGNMLNLPRNMTAFAFGSSCGLVSLFTGDGKICICNPILRQSRIIECPPYPFDMGLAFLWGFGYVSSKDDFKLVFASTGGWGQPPMVSVFSMRENNWRVLMQGSHQFHSLSVTDNYCKQGILVDECLHSINAPIKDGREFEFHVFAFDLVREVFEEIPIPKEFNHRFENASQISCISAIDGDLGACVIKPAVTGLELEIWVQKRYGQTPWVRLCNENLLEASVQDYGGFLLTEGRRLHVYSWSNFYPFSFFGDRIQFPAFEHLKRFAEDGISSIVDYVGSLVSPFGLTTQTPQEMKED